MNNIVSTEPSSGTPGADEIPGVAFVNGHFAPLSEATISSSISALRGRM